MHICAILRSLGPKNRKRPKNGNFFEIEKNLENIEDLYFKHLNHILHKKLRVLVDFEITRVFIPGNIPIFQKIDLFSKNFNLKN